MGQKELLIQVVHVLEGAGVPFMLTGSLASSLQGEPRSTHDIDLVVDLAPAAIDRLVDAFPPPRFHLDRAGVERAVRTRGLVNLLDVEGGDKVDLWMLTEDPFDQERFARRETVPVFGLAMPVSTPEDTILQKLVWSRLSGGSERQRMDARRVLEVQGPRLDMKYLREWASRLGIAADFDSLLS